VGNLVAFTIEASKRGKVDIDLDYGDVDGIVSLVEDIAQRRGLGGVLAEGIRHAAKEWGAEDLAVHVKGMSLACGTSDRGACHLRSTFYKFCKRPGNRFSQAHENLSQMVSVGHEPFQPSGPSLQIRMRSRMKKVP